VPEVVSSAPRTLTAGQSMASLGSGLGAVEYSPNEALGNIYTNNYLNYLSTGGMFDSNYLGGFNPSTGVGITDAGLAGVGHYGSGVDTVRVGSAKFQPRKWLMDYGGGNSINSYGLVGTPQQPNNQIRPQPPAAPDLHVVPSYYPGMGQPSDPSMPGLPGPGLIY
jgi:hypothetical protein